MIIGISGKIGSGKDTVAKMIQWLSSSYIREKVPQMEDYVLSERNHKILDQKWKIKRFADKLKDMVCLMIGCTRGQLEDREFKEKPLGEEWHVWKLHDGIELHIFSSKDDRDNRLSYLKEHMFGIYEESSVSDERLTPRKLMQLLGTEAGREVIHPNIWVNALFADYKKEPVDSNKYPQQPDWIIPDARFPNEAYRILSEEGLLIRVKRPLTSRFPKIWNEYGYASSIESSQKNDKMLRSYIKRRYSKLYDKLTHRSETALDDFEGDFSYIIENKSSLNYLYNQVKSILETENLI